MLNLKLPATKIILAVVGAVYLTTVSSLELNIFIKPYAAIVPIQLLALIYALYLASDRKSKKK